MSLAKRFRRWPDGVEVELDDVNAIDRSLSTFRYKLDDRPAIIRTAVLAERPYISENIELRASSTANRTPAHVSPDRSDQLESLCTFSSTFRIKNVELM